MAKKLYAVRKGREIGIFNTWEECKKQVEKFPGAEFKSFVTIEEARRFIENENLNDNINIREINDDEIIAYVDGSYNGSETEFSYGMVILDGKNEYKFSKKIVNEQLASMNNVAGEIAGAMAAMQYASDNNKSRVYIYHDYAGISKWCLGEWKTNKIGTIEYKKFYDEMIKRVDIKFVKVKGHSNNKYNDMADELAKKALEIC